MSAPTRNGRRTLAQADRVISIGRGAGDHQHRCETLGRAEDPKQVQGAIPRARLTFARGLRIT